MNARVVERLALQKEVVARELARLGFANMQDYGAILGTDLLGNLAPEQAAAVQEMTVETYMEGRGKAAREVKRVRVKLYDKNKALMDIARLFGWIIEKREETVRLEERLAAMKPEERAQDAREVLQRVQQRLLEYRQQMGEEDGPVIEGQAEAVPRGTGGTGRK